MSDLAHVKPPSNSEGTRTQVAKDDLLIVITGAGVTNPALLQQELGEAYCQPARRSGATDTETDS